MIREFPIEFNSIRSCELPLSAKNLELVRIAPGIACKYNELWHSTMPILHYTNVCRNKKYICHGFIYKSECFAVGIWSSPISRWFDGNLILELRRLAISDDSPKFTATRMISLMIKDIKKRFPDVEKLISYQDKEKHTGIIYKASNWKPAYETTNISWQKGRKRNVPQSKSKKIRWEYILKEIKNE